MKDVDMKPIIILCGPSCAGKDTIAAGFNSSFQDFKFLISTTSRPKRSTESEGNPYYFVSKEEFEELIKEDGLLEYREYNTLVDNNPEIWYYGVEKTSLDPDMSYVCVLDPIGIKQFKKLFKERLLVFYVHTPETERKQRCSERGDFNKFEWERRLKDDKIKFSKEFILEYCDYILDGSKSLLVNTTLIKNKIDEKFK